MRTVTIKQFHQNLWEEIKDLPLEVTRNSHVAFKVLGVSSEQKISHKISAVKPGEVYEVEEPFTEYAAEPVVAPMWNDRKNAKSLVNEKIEFHDCEHGGCKSPAVVQKGNKWFCIYHATQ